MADRHRGPRRPKGWSSITEITQLLTMNQTAGGGSIGFDDVTTRTVLRMIGEYVITPTSAPTALDGCRVTVGIGVMSSDAFAVGSSAMPDPADEPNYPWLYWMSHNFAFPGTDPESGSAGASVRQFLDIRSMRKLKPRESVFSVFQYNNVTGLPPMTVSFGPIRILFAN